MPTLYLMSGLPGSGKSVFARHLVNDHTKRVSRDGIRLSLLHKGESYFSHERQVERQYYDTVCSLLEQGYDVVADATHINAKSIKKTVGKVKKHCKADFDITLVYINVPFDVCKKRNAKRTGREYVPENVLTSMYDSKYNVDTIKEEIPEIDEVWRIDYYYQED